MNCERCGAPNPPNYVACENCGQRRVIRPPGARARTATPPPPVVPPPARHSVQATVPHHAPAAFPSAPSGFTPSRFTPSSFAPSGLAPGGFSAAVPVGGGGGRYAKDATRYLCAAVQLDDALNAKVLHATMGEPLRAIASSPGVDLVTVLRYGIAATRRQASRNVTLAVLLVVSVVTAGFFPVPLILLPLIAWVLAFWERYVTLYRVLARELRRENFDPAAAPQPSHDADRRRLDEIAVRDRGNVTVFPAYSPFIGFGNEVQKWSTVINTARAATGRTLERFGVDDLHRFVAADLDRLGLPGVSVDDRLFLNGLDLLGNMDPALTRQVLPDEMAAPLAQVDQRVLDDLRTDGKGRCRPYLMVRITGWSGEVVLTMFLRFSLLPDRDLLFIEANYALLPPVLEKYREADRLTVTPAPRQLARLVGQSALLVPGQVLGSLPYVIRMIAGPLSSWSKARRDARQIKLERSFNYGAVLAPREHAHANLFYRYFQEMDKEMYAKIAERRVSDSITAFMGKHGVDTSEFTAQQQMIINGGNVHFGDNNVNGPAAIGPMAKVLNKLGGDKK